MPRLEGNTRLISVDPFDSAGNLDSWLNVVQDLRRFQANPLSDVMLVQFLLIQVFKSAGISVIHRKGRPLTVDGVYGEITEDFVNQFQTNSSLQSRIQPAFSLISVRGDGKISRAPSGPMAFRYSIYRLQWALASMSPGLFIALISVAKAGKLSADFLRTGIMPAGVPVPAGLQVFFSL